MTRLLIEICDDEQEALKRKAVMEEKKYKIIDKPTKYKATALKSLSPLQINTPSGPAGAVDVSDPDGSLWVVMGAK